VDVGRVQVMEAEVAGSGRRGEVVPHPDGRAVDGVLLTEIVL
jgi:hypothetical protein